MNNRIRYNLDEIQLNVYYQMPKFLFESEFKNLSNDARVLYSLLRNQHNLSVKNKWINEKGEVYFIFTREKMCEILNLSKPTVIKSIKDLKKYNLIDERRLGQGKANQIYLLTVGTNLTYKKPPETTESPENTTEPNSLTSTTKDEFSEVKFFDFNRNDNEKIFTSESQNFLLQNVKNFDPSNKYFNDIEKKSVKSSQISNINAEENQTKMDFSDSENKLGQISNVHEEENQTKKNFLEKDNKSVELGQISGIVKENQTKKDFSDKKKEPSSILAANQALGVEESPSSSAKYITYTEWESRVKSNIDYNSFIQAREPYIKFIDTIVNNIVSIMIETNNTIILNKKENKTIRTADAKEICLRLKHDHIVYVLEKFKNVSAPITHKSNYLKSIILSSLTEIEAYYQNEYMIGNL